MRDNAPDDLDPMIDNALGSYSIDPRAGIEARVLERVRSDIAPRRVPFLRYAAVSVALLVAVMLWFTRQQESPRVAIVPSRKAGLPLPPEPPFTVSVSVPQKPQHTHHHRALRRRDVFPTPTPLTDGERALVNLAAEHPREARDLATWKQTLGDPIEIQPLQVPPLQSDGG